MSVQSVGYVVGDEPQDCGSGDAVGVANCADDSAMGLLAALAGLSRWLDRVRAESTSWAFDRHPKATARSWWMWMCATTMSRCLNWMRLVEESGLHSVNVE